MAQVPEAYRNNKENSNEEMLFPPIPAGVYLAVVDSSDYIPNNSNTGQNLKLVWQIIDGPQKNKKIFEYLCLEHPKTDVQSQAWRKFNKINDICGFPNERVTDSSELHNIPVKIKVNFEEGKDFPNSIGEHLPAKDMDVAAAPAPAQAQSAPAAEEVPAKSPWE